MWHRSHLWLGVRDPYKGVEAAGESEGWRQSEAGGCSVSEAGGCSLCL